MARTFPRGLVRPALVLAAFAVGGVFPSLADLSWIVPWFVGAVLTLSFLEVPLGLRFIERRHGALLAANVGIGLVAWAVLLPLGGHYAASGFLAGITPTAIAAPVITGMVGGNVAFVAVAVLVGNLSMCLLIPLLSALLFAGASVSPWALLKTVSLLVLVPFAISRGVAWGLPGQATRLLRFKAAAFYLWIASIVLISARTSRYLRADTAPDGLEVAGHAAVAAVICATGFGLGRWIGGARLARECSQALGQKNTSLTIWVGLTCFDPISALGPTFYVLWHNLYNAWQVWRADRRRP